MLSLLSNVNTDFILKLLSMEMDVVPAIGYGNIWGQLLDPYSALNHLNPDKMVFIIDIEELVCYADNVEIAKTIIDNWYNQFNTIISSEKDYLVSDVSFRTNNIEDNDSFGNKCIEEYWRSSLLSCINKNKNVHILKLSHIVEAVGKNSFYSEKLWFMGKIPYTNEASRLIANQVKRTLSLIGKINKKVLVLDLDNTLWGGILGEKGPEGIELSDDHVGAIYKNAQKKFKQMKHLGVMLAICSKNNEGDVLEVWEKNPHMLLKREDFVATKINWNDKADNILQIAKELNVGVDSFVFIDDMPNERENVSSRVRGVAVPEFPSKLDNYLTFIDSVFIDYFQHLKSTAEDLSKTRQYIENAKREQAAQGLSYEAFLSSLKLRVKRVVVDDSKMDRIVQLFGKTNQFNLTTKRYSRHQLDEMLKKGDRLYAYNVSDKFGDYGIVAVVIVDMKKSSIDSFIMSCRVMGKLVENFIIDDIEKELTDCGLNELHGEYIKTAKNAPVQCFFDDLGYNVVEKKDDITVYSIDLSNRPKRKYYVEV